MKDLIIALFGEYTPFVNEVSENVYTTSGALEYTSVRSVVSVDWAYILGVALFALCLYCVFRIIGSVFRR